MEKQSLQIVYPNATARGDIKHVAIPDIAVPVQRTTRNLLQHNEYSYVWLVEQVSSQDEPKSWKISSPELQLVPGKLYPLFQDNTWHFEMRLNSWEDEVALFLCLDGIDFNNCKSNSFNLCFEVRLHNIATNEFILSKACGIQRVDQDTTKFGWKNAISYSRLQNATPFHLRATMWTLGELKDGDSDVTANEATFKAFASQPCLARDVASMWYNQEWADMVLHVGYKSFPVHRAILSARSPTFQEMFRKHGEAEPFGGNSITLNGVDLECMELILEYIYTGHIGTTDTQKLNDLLELADKLQVNSCKTDCFHRLSERLTLENALTLAVMANTFGVCAELKERVKKFCLLHREELLSSKTFSLLMEKGSLALQSIFGLGRQLGQHSQ